MPQYSYITVLTVPKSVLHKAVQILFKNYVGLHKLIQIYEVSLHKLLFITIFNNMKY